MTNEQQGITEQQVADAINVINDCLGKIIKRIEEVEKYVSEIPTPDKTYYKPEGYDDYMNLKENFDEVYKRIGELENGRV